MPESWMSVISAAAALNCHTRTIERRIASGKIRSRRGDDGQVQVLIDVATNMSGNSPTSVDTIESVRELAQDQISLATGSASALVRLAQTDADRARAELAIARQELSRVRQGSRLAWISVAAMAASICIAVGWTAHRITQANDDIKSLNLRADRVETDAKRLLVESTNAKTQAAAARVAQAEASGKLAAYQEQAKMLLSDNRPTRAPATRPTNMLQRIADAMAGE